MSLVIGDMYSWGHVNDTLSTVATDGCCGNACERQYNGTLFVFVGQAKSLRPNTRRPGWFRYQSSAPQSVACLIDHAAVLWFRPTTQERRRRTVSRQSGDVVCQASSEVEFAGLFRLRFPRGSRRKQLDGGDLDESSFSDSSSSADGHHNQPKRGSDLWLQLMTDTLGVAIPSKWLLNVLGSCGGASATLHTKAMRRVWREFHDQSSNWFTSMSPSAVGSSRTRPHHRRRRIQSRREHFDGQEPFPLFFLPPQYNSNPWTVPLPFIAPQTLPLPSALPSSALPPMPFPPTLPLPAMPFPSVAASQLLAPQQHTTIIEFQPYQMAGHPFAGPLISTTPAVLASPQFARPAVATPVLASPVFATPVLASPVLASPQFARPAVATPVLAIPVFATPVLASPVLATPVLASPTSPALFPGRTPPVQTTPVGTPVSPRLPFLASPVSSVASPSDLQRRLDALTAAAAASSQPVSPTELQRRLEALSLPAPGPPFQPGNEIVDLELRLAALQQPLLPAPPPALLLRPLPLPQSSSPLLPTSPGSSITESIRSSTGSGGSVGSTGSIHPAFAQSPPSASNSPWLVVNSPPSLPGLSPSPLPLPTPLLSCTLPPPAPFNAPDAIMAAAIGQPSELQCPPNSPVNCTARNAGFVPDSGGGRCVPREQEYLCFLSEPREAKYTDIVNLVTGGRLPRPNSTKYQQCIDPADNRSSRAHCVRDSANASADPLAYGLDLLPWVPSPDSLATPRVSPSFAPPLTVPPAERTLGHFYPTSLLDWTRQHKRQLPVNPLYGTRK